MSNRLLIRFQYLNDSDPFDIGMPKPMIPVSYEIDKDIGLLSQIHEIHSLINCPLKV